ncbi:hypothetical protein FN976_17350 [Caenimonas sedimenti]|uniref:Uncharacterized protein n=1 Tax=Caenimonas sedimenti TaxID=2596921 RepID=A0A562ZP01_9BURK|nr:hypothetical protein [Caenimonas sedimenti]TWO70101.1 hypothetical protein FN976_17350 [Caenimonas sedimenti]
MTIRAISPRSAAFVTLMAAAAALTGCYVVPLQQPQPGPAVIHVPTPPPPGPVTFTARLYPSNDLASQYGMVGALVTNDLNGRGHFSTNIGGEAFTGEATRHAGSPRDGVANGAGNRGGYINCRYTMNSPTLGTGTCRLSTGATFTMHVGS